MKKPALSALFLVIMLFSVNAYLQETSVPKAGEEPQTGVQTLGDNPLQPLFSWSGNGGINFTKAVFLGIGNPADTLFLNTLPPNADIVQAYFAITSWQNTATTASATFNATSLGPDSAAAIDQGSIYFLSHYRWDVTDLIDGNGAFPFTTSDINLCYLVYLLVVYEDAGSPPVTVLINDGSESLQDDTSSTYFNNTGARQTGNILLYTQASDPSSGFDEYVVLNGDTVIGPGQVFNSNLGSFADEIILKNVEILEGMNKVTIFSGSDWLGFHLAILTDAELISDTGEQITVNSNDILGTIGKTHTIEEDTTGNVAINVGTPGVNQTWDLSGVSVQAEMREVSYVNPAATPFAGDFPAANFARGTMELIDDTLAESYEYANVTSSAYNFLGFAFSYGDTVFVSDEEDESVPLPLQYGSMWQTTSSDTIGDPATFAIVNTDTTNNTVDGWGTLILPSASYAALRIRFDEKTTQTTIVSGQVTSTESTTYIGYTWISDDEFVLAEAESQENETNPNFTSASNFFRLVNSTTSLQEDRPVKPLSFELRQNYPNPFNPQTKIEYTLQNAGFVELAVYDALGRQVALLVDGYKNAGSHSATFRADNLPSGIYLYRLRTEHGTSVKKMLLLK